MSQDDRRPHPEQEDFGESSIGEAQSSNPPLDPEMLHYSDEAEDEERSDEPAGDVAPDVIASAEDEHHGTAGSAEHAYELRHPEDARDEPEQTSSG